MSTGPREEVEAAAEGSGLTSPAPQLTLRRQAAHPVLPGDPAPNLYPLAANPCK